MALELWIAFVLASALVQVLPGPSVILVTNYALNHGRRTGFATVPGVALGDFTAMTTSLLGAGAILAASSTLFTALKIAGAIYLIWLGFKLWRSKPQLQGLNTVQGTKSMWSMFWSSYIVTALNPKGIVFFVALIPQFIDPTQPTFMQFAIMEATFVSMAAVNIALWVLLTDKFRQYFSNAKLLSRINKTSASFLMGAGIFTVLMGRSN